MRPGLRTLSTAQGNVTASSLGLRCVTAGYIRKGPWRPSQRLPGHVPWTGQAGWGVGWQQSWPQSHFCGPSGPSPGPGHAGHSPTLKPVVLSQHSGATPRGRQERLEPPNAGSLPGQGGVGFWLECLTPPIFFPNVCFCKNLQPASLVLENICRELNLAPKQVIFSSPMAGVVSQCHCQVFSCFRRLAVQGAALSLGAWQVSALRGAGAGRRAAC